MSLKIVVKNLPRSKVTRTFLDGSKRHTIQLKTAAIGLGTYQPGWKWSLHAGIQTQQPSGNHIGYIVSGSMVVRDPEGIETTLGPGDGFEVTAGHDAWVLGDEPCVALDFINTTQM